MREKYESLSLAVLRDLAKARGIKSISALRKPELIERMLEEDEKDKAKENAKEEQPREEAVKSEFMKSESAKPESMKSESAKPESAKLESGKPEIQRQTYSRPERPRYNEAKTFPLNPDMPRYERSRYNDARGSQQNPNQSRNERPRYNEARNAQPVQQDNEQPRYERPRYAESRGAQAQSQDGEQPRYERPRYAEQRGDQQEPAVDNTDSVRMDPEKTELDSGEKANGILEVMPDGFGFIRCANYLPGDNDVYVSPAQIRRFNMKTGDIIQGNVRIKTQSEKFSALLYVTSINGFHPSEGQRRCNFEDMTPIFPNERLVLERPGGTTAMRIVDLISPIGKGQRGMIVSPPKAGKTTLLKDVAKSVLRNNPETHLIILLIDERPEEVTDIKEAINGKNVEVIYSTFDETPERHKRVSEMVVERAKRLVEHKKDVVILLDSITRLARAYNLIIPPSGRTLSGGLDPAALHMPKRFFGAARNMREGGSLTILATALVDTGSKMDDVIYEEFKGTGNMELVLDRKLQEKRVFPAIDIQKSGTRREDLLLTREEQEAVYNMRRALNGMKADEAVEQILNMFSRTKTNEEFVQTAKKQKFL